MGHFSTLAFIWGLLMLLVFQFPYSGATQPDICRLERVIGKCRAAMPRYYFNTTTKTCQHFLYGGCDGNENNFRSAAECRLACTCTQDLDTGFNARGQSCRSSRSFYYDSSDGTCQSFRYQGCGGNGNRFRTSRQCLSACAQAKCVLPPFTGPCKAAITRYYYNPATATCETFMYGGCRGNENNFNSIFSCRRNCQYPVSYLTAASNWITNYQRTGFYGFSRR